MADTVRLLAPFALPEQLTESDLVAKYFKVLSDATRVRILELLEERGELSVGRLVEALGGVTAKGVEPFGVSALVRLRAHAA